MRNPFARGVGGVLSGDIAVPEHARELGFYAKVLATGSAPLWRDDLMNNRGTPIIGLAARTPEYEALPLQWMPHIQVADVAASAARAVEMGAHEVMHGKDENGKSQWAVLVDPMGAGFGLVPVVGDEWEVAEDFEAVGRIAGLMLVVPDVPKARAFYEAVIGWAADAAEIRAASGDHAGIPPVWLLGLPVGDLAESLRRVREGGGTIVAGSAESGHAVVRDPVEVHVMLQSNP